MTGCAGVPHVSPPLRGPVSAAAGKRPEAGSERAPGSGPGSLVGSVAQLADGPTKPADLAPAATGASPRPEPSGLFPQQLTSPYDHAIMNMALPAMLALSADPLLGIVDTAFVGHLPGNALVRA